MEQLHFAYLPKQQSIVYKEVSRPEGFARNSIHMHGHHELVLVTSEAVCRVINNGNPVTVLAPCVMLNRAGTFHEVVEVTCGTYDSRVVFFHPQVLTGIPGEMLFEDSLFAADLTAVSLSPQQVELLLPLFDMIGQRPFDQQLPLLLTVFAAVSRQLQDGAVRLKTTGSYVFDVIELLKKDSEGLTLPQLAQRFCVCQTKLKTDFKRITGLPVMVYKTQIRLEKARVLLETTDMEQAQIAYTCGFSDESYFIRAFKKQFSTTPAAYRRKLLVL